MTLFILSFTACTTPATDKAADSGTDAGDADTDTDADADTDADTDADADADSGTDADTSCPSFAPFDVTGGVRVLSWDNGDGTTTDVTYTMVPSVTWNGTEVWVQRVTQYAVDWGTDQFDWCWTCGADGAAVVGDDETPVETGEMWHVTYDSPQVRWPATLAADATWSVGGTGSWGYEPAAVTVEDYGPFEKPESWTVTAVDMHTVIAVGTFNTWQVEDHGVWNEVACADVSDLADGIGGVALNDTEGVRESQLSSCTGLPGC